MSPVGAIFVPFPLKTGTNLLHPLPPSIVERVAMGRQKYKNETQKINLLISVHFHGNYFCIFFLVCAPLWAGRVNKNKNKKMKNETEAREILAIQVSSPLV